MAIAPGRYDIIVQRRADYEFDAEFTDSDGDPMNLYGWQVIAQIWNSNRTQKFGDFIVTFTDVALGKVKFKIPYTVTTLLPFECHYDVMLINPSFLREYYIEGVAHVSEGYAAP
jgi:hypothetical protein